jgi:hypothetical protein
VIKTGSWCVIVVPLTEEVATTEMLATPDGVVGTGGVDELLPPPPQDARPSVALIITIAKIACRFREPGSAKAILTTLRLASPASSPLPGELGFGAGSISDSVPAVWKTSVEATADVPGVTFGGLKAQVEFAGRLAHDSVTWELNPPKPVTVMLIVAD